MFDKNGFMKYRGMMLASMGRDSIVEIVSFLIAVYISVFNLDKSGIPNHYSKDSFQALLVAKCGSFRISESNLNERIIGADGYSIGRIEHE